MAVCVALNNLEFLRVLVGNLCDTVHFKIAVDVNKAAACGRFKANKRLCGVCVFAADLECEEVTCAPIINDFAGRIKIFNRTCYFAILNFNIIAL